MASLNWIFDQGMKKQEADYHCFIYDNAYFMEQGYRKTRLYFYCQLCVDQQVDIFVGDMETILFQLIDKYHIDHLIVQKSYQPTIIAILDKCQTKMNISVLDPDSIFVSIPATSASFFTYYKKVTPLLRKRAQQLGQSNLDLK